jgi:2-amino-4-hydroxy-6-hydroxymethyldihydropteridine diphosphokinase
MKKNVIIAIGSNLGNRLNYIQNAWIKLQKSFDSEILIAPVYESSPWGLTQQPRYLNTVVSIQSDMSPQEILKQCMKIELENGRERITKWGSRTLDLDIILIDQLMIQKSDLIIPHPHLESRAFVLQPIIDLFPDLKHPKSQIPLKNYLSSLELNTLKQFDPCF